MPSGVPDSSPVKNCEECMELFKYKPSVEKKGFARFCSTKCQRTWQSFEKSGKKPYEMTEKTAAKLRALRVGLPSPNRGKKLPWLVGDKNHNWKGGVTSKNDADRKSLRYKQWRSAVFHRDNFTCQVCEQYSGTLHADHVKRWADNEELRYNIDNGRTLCVPCHYYITFKTKMKPGTRWCNFTARKRG